MSDMEAIERLHQQDMAASKNGDFVTLQTLLSADVVILSPGQRRLRGRSEVDPSFKKMTEAMKQYEVVEYIEEFEEVKILGEYAFEWGIIRGAMRTKTTGDVKESVYNVMRILQRQPDGEWKVHRSIWNEGAIRKDAKK